MLSKPRLHRRRAATNESQKGVALLEALIAILIFSLGILGLIGLQANATKTASQAKYRIDASQIASQRIGTIWVDQANLASYNESDTSLSVLPGGTRTTVVVGNQVTVTVSWQAPGDASVNSYQTVALVTSN
jgi:type IV pilus assembly protein PilV